VRRGKGSLGNIECYPYGYGARAGMR